MQTRSAQLPIWRDANRLLLEIERAVHKLPRYHKYALGSDLRRQAMDVCRANVRAANTERPERALERLVLAIEDLKISMQLAKELEGFASFAEFARIAALHHSGGRRVERPGWTGCEAGLASPLAGLDGLQRRLTRQGWSWVWVAEDGWLRGGLKRRLLRRLSLG